MRTEWEKSYTLSLKDVRYARQFFEVEDLRYWHITSIAAPHLRFVPGALFDGVDALLERIPGLQLMAWMFTFVMRSKT